MRKLYICLLIITAACSFGRDQPVYNVHSAPIVTGSGKSLSVEQVKATIIRAAVDRGWEVRDDRNGRLVATISPRQHVAIAIIEYDHRNFGIYYKDSSLLRYNGHTIHRNYNKWVQLLEQDIKQRFIAQ